MASKPAKGKYVDSLDKVSRDRYLSKLELIGGRDPYQVAQKEWRQSEDNLPEITYFDIVNYLVFTLSAYTVEEMKAYKSLEAYNQFVCGWVRDVVQLPVNDLIVLSAKVRHSQRMNETPLKPWIIANHNGSILAGHCNCMAGLGEVCSHVGALLFWMESAVKIKNSKTVTQEAAYWLLPTGIKNVEYNRVQDINFQSARSMKRKLDDMISGVKSPQPSTSKNIPEIPELTDAEFSSLAQQLHETQTKPVVLALLPDYTKHYIPSSLGEAFPLVLSELYDENCVGMSKDDLQKHCEEIFPTIVVSSSQADNVERETRNQANNKEWFRFRTGRITASRLKSVCRTPVDQPAKSVIQGVCYPDILKFTSKATKWGCEHEKTALTVYQENVKGQHDNFQCIHSGLVINPAFPYMGATPDSIISCDCCGLGTVEIKCPYCVRDRTLAESIDSKSCLEMVDGQLKLKNTHQYYYQVQAQLFICKREFCDFVVWTQEDFHIERIEPDVEFWATVSDKAQTFFKNVILPELVGKCYSRPQPSPVVVVQPATALMQVDNNQPIYENICGYTLSVSV